MPNLSDLGLSFSDVPNWRGRELGTQNNNEWGSTVAPGRQYIKPAPRDPKYDQLPLSENVEDRRMEGTPWLDVLSQEWLGLNLPQAIRSIQEKGLTPPEQQRFRSLSTPLSGDPLASSLGYNDLARSMNYRRSPNSWRMDPE